VLTFLYSSFFHQFLPTIACQLYSLTPPRSGAGERGCRKKESHMETGLSLY
jgi:hypothetical protein